MTAPEEVLDFWFGGSTTPDVDLAPYLRRWFRADAALDRVIAERFGAALQQAGRGELDRWSATPRGCLALIVLMDQFSRNAFRGMPSAFAWDAEAARLCREGLAAGADRGLMPVERLFFYLPLLHAEDRADQLRGVACFARLAEDTPGAQQRHFAAWLRTARRCRQTINWFGRFPHRNAVLGRQSTAAERCFVLAGRIRRYVARRVKRNRQ